MSDSDVSSASTSSDSPRGGSPAPESVPVPETAIGPANKCQLVIETNPTTETEANYATAEPEANAPVDVEQNPDAKPLHITRAKISEGAPRPGPSLAIE